MEMLVPSLRAITILPLSKSSKSAAFPVMHKSKQTNGSPDSPASVKYYSYLITYLPLHPGEFIQAKCRVGHNVSALECIMNFNFDIDCFLFSCSFEVYWKQGH